ncbi:hypothetical protein ABES58_24370 [Paenibacillus lautus]|uniref:cache domain-containing protein n=1 Tax=Paenibacillus lautus TaxID=1401 RepID=UPI003D291907
MMTDKTLIKNNEFEDKWLQSYIEMDGYSKWIGTHKVRDGGKLQDVITLIHPYPLISSPGYRKGLVAVNINEDVLYRMVSVVFEGDQDGVHTFIIDDKGNIVTHDDKMQLYKNVTDIPYMKPVLDRTESGQFTAESNGASNRSFI